jgi:hypothetical protein
VLAWQRRVSHVHGLLTNHAILKTGKIRLVSGSCTKTLQRSTRWILVP